MKQIETNKIPIYLNINDVPNTGTRKELVQRFLSKKCNTYSDIDCTDLQCEKNRYRSVSELYYIVCTRFPKTSFKGFIKIIHEVISEKKQVILVWCTKVNKVTIRYVDNPSAEYMSYYSRKSYFEYIGEDGLSLENLEKLKNSALK